MTGGRHLPRLRLIHPESSLSPSKLEKFRRLSTGELLEWLRAGEGRLKRWTDGTVMDGHHRLAVLAERGVDIDALPRQAIDRSVAYD